MPTPFVPLYSLSCSRTEAEVLLEVIEKLLARPFAVQKGDAVGSLVAKITNDPEPPGFPIDLQTREYLKDWKARLEQMLAHFQLVPKSP
jgi:hypothetical protein